MEYPTRLLLAESSLSISTDIHDLSVRIIPKAAGQLSGKFGSGVAARPTTKLTRMPQANT
jgi:hypothetical protein